MKAFPGNRFEGMDLRDYFAAQAMKPLITIIDTDPNVVDGDDFRDKVASAAYLIADAMMKAREIKHD